MRAAIYDEYGGADVLEVREVDDPPVGPDTVLVRARATSVNPVDWKIREGYLQAPTPTISRSSRAGTSPASSRRSGPRSHRPEGGRRGLRLRTPRRRRLRHHGRAGARARADGRPQARLAGFEEAAAIPLAGLTPPVWSRPSGQAGRPVLIHAASGGVGHLAVQIAKALGATVVGLPAATTTGSARSAPRGARLRRRPDQRAAAGPVDAVLDLIGGEALADAPKQVWAARGSSRSSTPTRCWTWAVATSSCVPTGTGWRARRPPTTARSRSGRRPSRSTRSPRPTGSPRRAPGGKVVVTR